MVMTIYSSTFGLKSRIDRRGQKSGGGPDHLSSARTETASNFTGEALRFHDCRGDFVALAYDARIVDTEIQEGQHIQCG
jgi:hypothetical protein